jgi:acyl-CoA thioester hydrolase
MTVETVVPLRWSDMDAMRHVNNATYLSYFETAREPWFERMLVGDDPMRWVLRRVEVDFRSQLTYADGAVRVTVALEGIGTSSVRTVERITAESDGRLVAEARTVIVRLDESGLRSEPIPDQLRELLLGATAPT